MSIFDSNFFLPAGQSVADQFNGLVGRSPSPDLTGQHRAAMVFTSTLRQLLAAPSQQQNVPKGTTFLLSPNTVPGGNLLTTTVLNSPGIVETSLSEPFPQNAMTNIAMALNPKSIKFSQPKRFSRKDTLRSTVFFHFTDSKGQNNDILTLSFTGNTGNLDARAISPGVDGNSSLQKLRIWHNLYLLTREPMILTNGIENEFRITYASALLPITIDFIGFFSKVLEFSEVAEKPFSREYSMDFIVKRTDPDLDYYVDLIANLPQAGALSVTVGSATTNNTLSATGQ